MNARHISMFLCILLIRFEGYSASGIDLIEVPELQQNVSSMTCILKFCEKYFRSEKQVIGSLVIINLQNASEFHSEFIRQMNEGAGYELGVMIKDATKKHGNPVHVVDKAKNYFVILNRTEEVLDALGQW